MPSQHWTEDDDAGSTGRMTRNISANIDPDGYIARGIDDSDRSTSDLIRGGLYRMLTEEEDTSPEIDDPVARQRITELEAYVDALSRKIDARTTRVCDDE